MTVALPLRGRHCSSAMDWEEDHCRFFCLNTAKGCRSNFASGQDGLPQWLDIQQIQLHSTLASPPCQVVFAILLVKFDICKLFWNISNTRRISDFANSISLCAVPMSVLLLTNSILGTRWMKIYLHTSFFVWIRSNALFNVDIWDRAIDRSDVSLPSHRLTNGWQPLKNIVTNGWLT